MAVVDNDIEANGIDILRINKFKCIWTGIYLHEKMNTYKSSMSNIT